MGCACSRGLVPGFAQDSLTAAPFLPSQGLPAASLCHGDRVSLQWPLGDEPLPAMSTLVSLPYTRVPTSRTGGCSPQHPVYRAGYHLRFGPSLGQRGAFRAAAWGRRSSRSSVLFGAVAKPHTLPGEQARTEEGAHLLLPCPQPLGTRFPALSTQQLPGSAELV